MTYEEYLEGLGLPPEEIPAKKAEMQAAYARQLERAADAIEDGCILSDDQVEASPWGA